MSGKKLSAKASEEVEFLEQVLRKCDHLGTLVEQYSAAKKGADSYVNQIARELGHLRQNAMIKNLGFVADNAGTLGIAAGRGSQVQRSRTLREGLNSLKQLVDRTIKATIEADERDRKEKERLAEIEKAARERTAARAGAEQNKAAT